MVVHEELTPRASPATSRRSPMATEAHAEAGSSGRGNGNGNGNGNGAAFGHGPRMHKQLDVYHEVLRRLRDAGVPEAEDPSFEDELWNHFHRFPARYAMDVNVESAEDVVMHMKLLQEARDPAKRPAFSVKSLEVSYLEEGEDETPQSDLRETKVHQITRMTSFHHPPFLGSTTGLLAVTNENSKAEQEDNVIVDPANHPNRPMHEITFASDDKQKRLNYLTSLLGELDLNIKEAHAFTTNDGYSIDVFIVVGWPYEEIEELTEALQNEIQKIEAHVWGPIQNWSPETVEEESDENPIPNFIEIPNDGTDDFQIDFKLLKFEKKVASGTYGDLYRGTYCSQDVAIKVLKTDKLNENIQKEFAHEVFIMRRVQHKNIVKFIGACTDPSKFCIVTEFMVGGSVYDYIHKQKIPFKAPAIIRAAIDISKGMSYLHHMNIIHRDLKTANLLLDENQVVKVADFGVARVKAPAGIMTAETGTYRWMAPEVIEHKPYDHKADVYSFAVVMWELLTGKIPYEYYTPLQAAIGVVQKGLRPTIPKNTHPKLTALLERCWQQDPEKRPEFTEILEILQEISEELAQKDQQQGGIFTALKKLGK